MRRGGGRGGGRGGHALWVSLVNGGGGEEVDTPQGREGGWGGA